MATHLRFSPVSATAIDDADVADAIAALAPASVDHDAEVRFLVAQVVRRTLAGFDLAQAHCARYKLENDANLINSRWDDIDISHLLDAEEAMARAIRLACGRPRTEDESTPARTPILSLTIDERTFMLLPSEASTYAAFSSAYPYTRGFDLVETTTHFVGVELA